MIWKARLHFNFILRLLHILIQEVATCFVICRRLHHNLIKEVPSKLLKKFSVFWLHGCNFIFWFSRLQTWGYFVFLKKVSLWRNEGCIVIWSRRFHCVLLWRLNCDFDKGFCILLFAMCRGMVWFYLSTWFLYHLKLILILYLMIMVA